MDTEKCDGKEVMICRFSSGSNVIAVLEGPEMRPDKFVVDMLSLGIECENTNER